MMENEKVVLLFNLLKEAIDLGYIHHEVDTTVIDVKLEGDKITVYDSEHSIPIDIPIDNDGTGGDISYTEFG